MVLNSVLERGGLYGLDASDGHAAPFEVIWVKKGSEVQVANS